MAWQTLRQLKAKNKKVLLRADFNISFSKNKARDAFRIATTKPTIDWLQKNKAKIIILTHWGRPAKISSSFSLRKLLPIIQETLNKNIIFAPGTSLNQARNFIKPIKPSQIVLLENIRFYPGEVKDSLDFAKKLAGLGDVFVNDAFSVSHRPHASIKTLPKLLPAYAGFLLEKEVKILTKVLASNKKPLVFVMGGGKAHDKLALIKKILARADFFLLGGVLANTFLKAAHYSIGQSAFDQKALKEVKDLVGNEKIVLPEDVIVATSLRSRPINRLIAEVKKNESIFDLGPKTIEKYKAIIEKAKLVVWNGPMGYYEVEKFSFGTNKLAQTIANLPIYSIAGGGDLVSALHQLKLANKFSHLSTGGGAMLEFLAGTKLPGLKALGYYD